MSNSIFLVAFKSEAGAMMVSFTKKEYATDFCDRYNEKFGAGMSWVREVMLLDSIFEYSGLEL